MQPSLTPALLADLRKPRPYPAVSVALPTHRTRPDSDQNAIRLNNLVTEALRKLEEDPAVTREHADDVARQLRSAVEEFDPARAREGLVILAAPGEQQTWTVCRSVPERVVLSDTFLTRNLVASDAALRPYWVLTVAADRIALWSGQGEDVAEDDEHDFPLTRSLDDPDVERKEQIGDVPSTYRDEQARQFFRDADTALAQALAAEPRPLYVAGEPAAITLLGEVGQAARDAEQIPHGGLAHGPADAVARAVAPARTERAERAVTAAHASLDAARGHKAYAAGLDEVWEAATSGRVELLVVEEHFRATVRAGEGHLIPAEDDDADAIEDIVDDLVESVLEAGGEVQFVPDESLADGGRVAAALRY
ncbi:baeRF3 domain-containing protein [Streptomyces luteolus]|uniref:Chemotaxis protein n=1 Tax=Streptomyces luteolus TaxID=3043615 RepID=A0ABT6T8K0_9ACTN|nr:chemotaxis protein [Streptomyces sp. B-S-A12]MDI3424222.1 chemotaxis protein [Streptomyces sp. B-S-A12]